MKATVKCVKVLARAATARAVIVAALRQGPRYVLLSHEERYALYRELGVDVYAPKDEAFPALVRSHAIDVETGVVDQLLERIGVWINAEELWVRADVAARTVESLAAWRREHPPRPGHIHAPDWITVTAVRALAFAAGLPDPMPPAES